MSDPVIATPAVVPSAVLPFRERLWFQVEKTLRSGHFWVAAIVATLAGIVKDMDSATLLSLTNAFPFLKGYAGIIVPFAVYMATSFKPSNAIGPQTQALIDAAVRQALIGKGVTVKPAVLVADPTVTPPPAPAPAPAADPTLPPDEFQDLELEQALEIVRSRQLKAQHAQRVMANLQSVLQPRAEPLEPHPLNDAPLTKRTVAGQ